MDAFLIDGMEIIFRLAVAILNFGKEDLLSLDMEGMLKVCNKRVIPSENGSINATNPLSVDSIFKKKCRPDSIRARILFS